MAKQALEIIPAKISFIGERFSVEGRGNRPDLPPKMITYVTTPTYECQCGTWTRQSMLKTFRSGRPSCPNCLRAMTYSKRTLRPLIRSWGERLEEATESYAN